MSKLLLKESVHAVEIRTSCIDVLLCTAQSALTSVSLYDDFYGNSIAFVGDYNRCEKKDTPEGEKSHLTCNYLVS